MTHHSLKPGTLIVLEGLDKTGKSTQSDALRRLLARESTAHIHMPSGLTAFTDETYSMLESAYRAPKSGVAKQLAHLACHAESVPRIQELLATQAVVLDRWWWSTLAYGWYSGDFPEAGVEEASFRNLIDSIWSSLAPSIVFLFDKPYETDANNSDPILNGYHEMAKDYADITMRVQQGDAGDVTNSLIAALHDRHLLER